MDKVKCKFDNLVSQPYGFKYEIKEQQFYMMRDSNDDLNKEVNIVKDNRNLLDKSENQKLTRSDIEELKKIEDISATVEYDSNIELKIILII